MSQNSTLLATALLAITARIDGKFDAPELQSFGPLSTSANDDIKHFAATALAAHNAETGTSTKVFTASEAFDSFLNGLRESGTELQGTNKQVTALICSSLQIVNPDSDAAQRDAEALEMAFEVVSENMDGDDADYPEDDEDEDEDEEGNED